MFNNPYSYGNYSMPTYNSYMPTNQARKIMRVNGENGAKAIQLQPNEEILALDETAPILWLAQADGAGYKSLIPYSITEYKPAPPIDFSSIEQRLAKIEGVIFNDAKSDTTGIEQSKE